MNKNFFAPGAIYNDNHKEITINGASNAAELVRAFMADEAEDVEPVQEDAPMDQFKYIHVNVTDEKEREQIHKMVYNIVRLPKMQQVCDELYKLMKDKKVLCTINPDSMLVELRRMGLPDKDINGFSDKNFAHYYRAPKLA